MLSRLVACVTTWPQERINSLLIQDMALCQAWYDAWENRPSRDVPDLCIPDRVAAWEKGEERRAEDTMGRRHQPLLRALLGVLAEERCQELNGDELAFLCAVCDIIDRKPKAEAYARLRELLAPHRRALAERRRQCPPAPKLASLAERVHYATEEDIRRAPMRETRLLAGIELPCRGPVMTCSGDLRILGDVPENCTVVVEGGACCYVQGYVLGRVLSKTHCEVQHNVSGIVIVLNGDIRAKSVINNALVVAKMGSVYCRTAQGPKLIFAGKRITIAEGTMLGHFVTRSMEVANDVRGGRIQISEQLQAPRFRHLGGNMLGIVLRRELNCQDFGEITGAELNRLLSQAYRLRRILYNFETMAEMARRDVEHKAQSALMYLFGGTETHKKLEEIVGLQRRYGMLTRIMENLRDVIESAQENAACFGGKEAAQSLPEPVIPMIDEDEPLDQDLAEEQENARKLQQHLENLQLDTHQANVIIQQAQEEYRRLYDEREALQNVIAIKEKEMQATDQYEKFFAMNAKGVSKLELLQRILPTIKQQSSASPLAKRLGGGLIAMALASIERQQRNIQEYETQVKERRRDFRSVSDRLGKDFQIRVLEKAENSAPAKAIGRFEKGVHIYMDNYAEPDSELPEGCLIVTPESDEICTYTRPTEGALFHLHSSSEEPSPRRN